MKTFIRLLLAVAAAIFPLGLSAQTVGPISVTGSGCATIGAFDNISTVSINVAGSWTGTIQPKGAIQGQAAFNMQVSPAASATPQSTITANGAYVVPVAGLTLFEVCGNTVTGIATIYMNASQAFLGSIGGASGGVTSGGIAFPTAGSPPPASVTETNCSGVANANWWIQLGAGGYAEQAGIDATGTTTSPTGTGILTFCRPFRYNDKGATITEVKEAFRIDHLSGKYTNPTAGRDERSVAILFSNTGTENYHQVIGGIYSDWTMIGNPTFAGHPGGENSAQIFRGNLTDARTNGATLSGAGFYVYTAQFEKQTTAVEPSGSAGVYRGVFTNEASGNQSGTRANVYVAQCDDITGTVTSYSCAQYSGNVPNLRFPTNNYFVLGPNMGTNTNDFVFAAQGVNASGTAAGFNYFVGPANFGTAAAPTSGFQVDISGGALRLTGNFNMTAGVLAQYSAITTAGLGIPVQVGNSVLSGQTTSLGPTTLVTVGAATASYLVVVDLTCKTAVATATISVTINYTDASNTAQSIAPSAAACTALGASSFALINSPIRAKNGTTITYSTTAANSPNYDISAQVYERSVN